MRSIAKLPMPDYLAGNADRLTADYIQKVAEGKTATPWQHDEIRDRLYDETDGRCAYCDSIVRVVAYEHIDHIEPKSRHPEKVVSWTNLTVACPRCNINKGDYCSHETPLVSPYNDDPRTHLIFLGPLVLAQPGDDRGLVTVTRLKLSRAELAEARTRRIEYFESLVDRWKRAAKEEIRDAIAEIIRDEITDGEYRSTVEAFLHAVNFPVRARGNAA